MIGVIADDLTGAAEIGAVGLRHGLGAEILVGPGFKPLREPRALPGLLCLDTNSRFCAAAESMRRAAAAARFLRRAGVDFIYKKVDSVLRGQVVPEIQAIMGELDFELALLVPANPSLGRIIRNGHYFIHDEPIHETEFARDPSHPRKFSDVLKLLGRPKEARLHIGQLPEPLPQAGIVVGNVMSSADVKEWAGRKASGILAAGGAEFFSCLAAGYVKSLKSLARAHARPKPAASRLACPGSQQLFICGSTSEATRQFIAAQRTLGTPLLSLPPQVAHGGKLTITAAKQIAAAATAALESHPRIVLHIGLPLIRRATLAKRLSSLLVRIAVLIIEQAPVDHVFVEGGATAIELVQAMRVRRLIVLNELAPGVATLAVDSQPQIRLTMKPGSYRWPFEGT